MNRTIQFRGKAVKCSLFPNGEWVDGYYYEDTIAGIPRALIKSGELDVIVEPESIGQFTGLLDKNGKEIYEGDIIRYIDSYGDEYITIARYDGGAFIIDVTGCDYDYIAIGWAIDTDVQELWVIGNIHDNHELLEGGEK